jgi:hypothetical protein
MYNKIRLFFLSSTAVAVLILSAIGPTPAYADDGPTSGQPVGDTTSVTDPPPIEAPATSEPAASNESAVTTEPATSSEAPATSEPIAASEPAVPAEAPVTSEQAAPAPTDEPVIDSTLLEAVPENTTIAVVDSNGETQPLVAQATADAITLSDPIWCPEGQSPTPGSNGCTQSFSSFTQLLTHLQANEASYQQAGTIYVQMGTYSGGESSIDFNSYSFTTFNTYNLSIQGGWDTSGDTIDPTVGTSFNAPMVVGTSANPWVGSLTFNNVQFGNISNNTALTAYSQNNITLTDVKITDINNGNAATLGSTNGNVTISGGEFNNSNTGAEINAGGNVTIQNNVEFKNNKKAGAVIKAGGLVNISNAVFDNNDKGLEIKTNDNVSLYTVEANNNKQFGANIQAGNSASISNSFFSGNVSYSSSKCGNSNAGGGYGLQVIANGPISVYAVTANNNYLYGASLSGSYVSVGNSFFNNNGSTSKNGTGKGLEVSSTSSVSLYNVEASNNKEFGANIHAVDSVSINNSIFSGNVSYYSSKCGNSGTGGGYGLQVVTNGLISVNAVNANNNYLYGASLSGSNVSVANSFFNNNGSTSTKDATGKGLEINSTGSVSLYAIEASNNKEFGANIHATDRVEIYNSVFSGNVSYTSSKCGNITGSGYGLQVVTNGLISANAVTANNNYLYGASLSGSFVNVSNSSFNTNGSPSTKDATGKGLEINSTGSVSLYAIEASNNKEFGANIHAVDSVEVSNSIFSGNIFYTQSKCSGASASGYGLQVVTTGAISINQSTTASNNGTNGAILNNKADVTVSDSIFDKNGVKSSSSGLSVTTTGDVSLISVVATNNGLDGVDVFGNCANDVFVTDGTYSGNAKYGLKIVNATLTLSGAPVFASNGSGNISQTSTCSGSGGHSGGCGGHGSHHGNSHYDKHHYNYHYDNKKADHKCSR